MLVLIEQKKILFAQLIGFQNDNGNLIDSEEYKAYQRVLEFIMKEYGEY